MEAFRNQLISELKLSDFSQDVSFEIKKNEDITGYEYFQILPPESCSALSCIENHRARVQRSATSPASQDMAGPAVMYLPLGNYDSN